MDGSFGPLFSGAVHREPLEPVHSEVYTDVSCFSCSCSFLFPPPEKWLGRKGKPIGIPCCHASSRHHKG